MKLFRVGLLFTYFISTLVFANSDSQVVNNYMNAIKSGNFELAAEQIDKYELEGFKQLFVNIGEIAESKRKFNEFSTGPFADFKTLSDLKQADPKVLFSKIMQMAFSQDNEMMQLLNSAEYKYIGSIREDDTHAYGVIKLTMTIAGEPIPMSDIVPLIIRDDRYYIGMKADMKVMANSFKAYFEKM